MKVYNLYFIWTQINFIQRGCIGKTLEDYILLKYSEFYPGTYWIEDKVKNAIAGKELGLEPLLIKHPHIKVEKHLTEGIPLMSNWRMVYEQIGGWAT